MIKGKIINFEWLCDNNYFSHDRYDVFKIKKIKSDIEIAYKAGYNLIIALYLIDGFSHLLEKPDNYLNQISEIKKFVEDLKMDLIIISGQGESFPGLPVKSVFFDYTLRMVIESYKSFIGNDFFKNNIDVEKFLFLGGAPDRENRTGLLSKFYDSNLLKYAEWSYFPPIGEKDKKWCRNCLSRYSDDEYQDFMKICERSFDNKYNDVLPYYYGFELFHDVVKTDFIKNASFIPPEIFAKTSFSIISEGPNFWSDDHYILTEKSWRTFLLKHPFIFAGHPDQFRYLKKLGFKTFEEYMKIKDYAYIENDNMRYDSVVVNTENFLKDMKNFKEQIEKDVIHNYNLFFEYVKKQDNFLKTMKNDYNVDQKEISFYFNRTGYEQLIVRPSDGEF